MKFYQSTSFKIGLHVPYHVIRCLMGGAILILVGTIDRIPVEI